MSRSYSVALVGALYGVQALSLVSDENYDHGTRVADEAVALVLASGVRGQEDRTFCLTRSFQGTELLGWVATENLVPLEGARYY